MSKRTSTVPCSGGVSRVFVALAATLVAFVATLAACSSPPAGESCNVAAHACDTGHVCLDGVCVPRPAPPATAGDAEVPEPDVPGCVPTGDEICGDGRDNNCDGLEDEGFTYGADGAKPGEPCDAVGECGTGVVVCLEGGRAVTCSTNPDGQQFAPGVERCDGLDNDCDGLVDNGHSWQGIALGAPCLGGTGCGEGIVACASDGTATCSTLTLAVAETCDGIDEDCNGTPDDGLVWNGIALGAACAGEGACGAGIVECFNGLAVCSVNPDGGHSAAVAELCDLLDNDCDGEMDEGFFPDGVSVGSDCLSPGICGAGRYRCADEGHGVCSTAPGQPDSPSTPELCNGLDDDCDGVIDNGITAPDGVALGAACAGVGRCPDGQYVCGDDHGVICSTLPPSPLAVVEPERCNRVDDDCNGLVDDGLDWFGIAVGDDCDPVGECGVGIVVCGDDERALCSTAPGGPGVEITAEVCDAADNDCDGEVDEDFTVGVTPLGGDCTSVGVCGAGHWECTADAAGVTCDSGRGASHDASTAEVCDGLDNDCDGATDEDFSTVSGGHVGDRCDGFGVCIGGHVECAGLEAVRCSIDQGGSEYNATAEVCNGLDDDCDGETDETDPHQCTPCAVDGARGVCGDGAFLCTAGRLVCVALLPAAGTERACDGRDNDCDSLTDEADEVPHAPSPDEARALGLCGAPRPPSGGDSGECAAHPDPLDPACAGWHPCVEAACRSRCQESALDADLACDAVCAGDDPLARSACLLGCRDRANTAHVDCMRACPPLDLVATGYACGAGPEGATCAPVCPDGYSLQGDGCVPAGEACNNGVDDDHDGLIDGVLTGEDPCAASLAPAVPVQLGTCDPLAAQSCDAPDDAARLAAGGGLKPRDTCTQAPCPARVRLDYAYALDREEVSLRAYLKCVRTGCCLAASGALYKKAERFLEANEGNLRPEAAARTRCEAAPDPEDPAAGARLLDLPVTGVTWCQARDYCHWAGKRLATEVELAHASAGDAPIRRHPWGDGELPECGADQACRSSDCAPGDASCEALGLCPADAQPAAGRSSRRACFARYGGGEVLCGDTGAVPTPVWANEDGATPEGVLNLTGNVAEWAFDWSSPNLDGLPDADSVGPACGSDAFGTIARRVVRGQTPSEPAARMHGFARTAIGPAAREPFLGFRCARTEDASGGRCVDDVPSNRRDDATCQPPPLPVGATEVACGPSFGAVTGSALDQAVCGGVRVQTEACAANLPSVCPAGGPGPSCGGFALTRLRLFNQAFPNVDPATGDAFAGLFDLSFAPNGGDTWLLLDTPAEFGHQDGLAGASFGTALPVGDALTWLGVSNGAECGGLEHTQGLLLRSGFGQIAPICGEARPGELLAPEVATRLHWSGLAMALIYNARSDTLGGGVALAFSQADALQSMLGGERLTEVLQRLRVPRLPLCNSAAIGGFLPGCAGAPPLGLAGCVGDVCTDPETCTGFVLPLELAAVRISRALVDGHLPATLVCP